MSSALKSYLRAFLYALGVLDLVHRVRNRRTLTVFMFHRVLPNESLEYRHAEREFTMSTGNFAECLEFLQTHYALVSHSDLRAALIEGKRLPDRAGLVTFDDGWRDTLKYALPALVSCNIPAVLFLSTEVPDLTQDRWWQDHLVQALAANITLAALEADLGILHPPNMQTTERIRHLTAFISEMDAEQRSALLLQYAPELPLARQMVTRADLARFAPLVAIAGHGHSHGPLTHLRQPQVDLKTSSQQLKLHNADSWAMSFPHGAHNHTIDALARQQGFEICYTSDANLVSTAKSTLVAGSIGRIHIPENQWTCEGKSISKAKLAMFLFFRSIKR